MLEFFAGRWRRAGRVADQRGLACREPGFRPPLSPGHGRRRIYRNRRTNSVTHSGVRVRGFVSERELVADHPVDPGQLRVLNVMNCEISRARRPRHNSPVFFLQSALDHCGSGVPRPQLTPRCRSASGPPPPSLRTRGRREENRDQCRSRLRATTNRYRGRDEGWPELGCGCPRWR